MDYYATLGVSRDAPHDVIRGNYRRLALRWHPDAGGDPRRMQQLSEAWAVLSRAERRKEYDRLVAEARVGPPTGPTPATSPPDRDLDTLDYGRYQGWTIRALAVHDPDYLEWLRRSPSGRVWKARIDLALESVRTPVRVHAPPPRKGRKLWGRR